MSQSFLSSDFLKSTLDGVIALVDGLNELIDTFGTLPTLFTAFTAFKSFSGDGFFKTVKDEATGAATGITNAFKLAAERVARTFDTISLRSDSSFKTGLQDDIIALQNYHNAVQSGMSKTEALSTHMKNAGSAAVKFAQDGKFASNWMEEFTQQQQSAQVSLLAQNKTLGSARTIIKEYYNGCKNVGMSQQSFADAVSKTNPILGKQLGVAKSAKSAFAGYVTSLIGAKVATVALEVATMAMNAALTMGVSLIISGIVNAISKWINAEEELAEKVDEVTSKFQEEHKALKELKNDYDTTNESSMVSKYAKLSKGVDGLGRNVSLTADEYSEYQSIVSTIADQIPSLVSGYNSQGDAILSCKDNIEELTTAYQKLIHAQNVEILTNTGNIEKDFANTLENMGGDHWWSNGHGFWKGFLNNKNLSTFSGESLVSRFFDYELKTDTVKALEKLLDGSGKYDKSKIYEQLSSDAFSESEIRTLLENANVDIGYFDDPLDVLEETLKTDPSKIKNAVDNYYEQFAEAVEEQKTIAQAKLSEAFDISSAISGLNYENISEELQAVASQTVNSLDFDFFSELQEKGISVEQWTDKILEQLDSIDNIDKNNKIESAFDLQTQFNGGDIAYGEYVKGLEDAGNLIEQLDLEPELESQLKLSLGLDEEGLVKGYHDLANRLADESQFDIDYDTYHNFLDGLSAEEVSVLIDIIPELSESEYRENIDDLKAALEKEMMLQGLTFDLNLEVESAGIESLNTALAESVTGSGLSAESIAALKARYADLEAQGYDVSAMFENTSHGIHLNREEFNKFEKELSSQKIAEIDSDLKEMKNTYDKLGEQIRECDDPIRKSELFSERQLLGQRIAEAAELATQYKGLTSAYNDWLAAEEAGSERDMYENIIEGFETVGDEISRGWLDDGTIKFLELITGRTDLATLSAKELKGVWKDLDKNIEHTSYSVRDFFTVDEDGNSTSQGVYNFLDAIGQMEEEAFGGKDVVQRKDGKIIGFDFQIAGGDKAIAEALGISEELVQIMKRAAEDAGFVVSMDGTYKEYAVLANEAEAAANKLKELSKENEKLKNAGGDFQFDFDTTSITNLEEDLKQANKILDTFKDKDGNINLKADGAIEAMQIVSTLQARLDDLRSEQYGIGLTVEDEKYEEPLENLQEYGRTVATLNQLKINPNVNTEEIEKLEGNLEDISKYFANLDGDLKVKLGFEADDNWEEVQKKIESGEVKIPTTLDIQTNMDKNLEDLKKIALLGSGLLSDEQEEKLKLEILADVDVKAGEVDDSDVEDKVDEAIHGGGGKRRESTREQNIEIIAETFGVEDVDSLTSKLKKLEDKQIQAIAEVLGQTDVDKLKNTFAKLEPKTVEAIAKAIGEGDVDALKTAIINIPNKKHAQAIAEAFGYSDVNELASAVEGMDGNTVQAVAQALGLTDVNTLQITINNMQGNTVDAKVNTEGQAGKINTLQTTINSLKGRTVDIVINTFKNVIETVASGGKKKAAQRTGADPDGNGQRRGGVNGTANVNGTAFKQGSWGTKSSGTALVGELGREVLVRDGRYYTIGNNGAEFIKYKKGDIIFNHVQSEQLFKNGKVTAGGGRAKAFANGTAFANGSYPSSGAAFSGTAKDGMLLPEKPSFKIGYDYNASSDSDSKKSQEIFDWIEVAIERIERSIDRLDQKASNVYKNWSYRNNALASEITEVGNEIALQQKAYEGYMSAANQVGLSSEWKKKVQSGAIDIDNVTDETIAEKIGDYQKYYEAALACQDAILELKETEAALYKQRFDNVATQYEGALSIIEHEKNMLEEYISQSEASAWLVSSKYYDALAKNEQENISKLKQEKNALLSSFNSAMQSGTIDKYSEAWYEMVNAVDEVTLAITEGETALKEYAQAIQEIKFEQFDLLQDRISSVTEEVDFLVELLSSDKLYDDRGQLTNEGSATMGLWGVSYNTFMHQSNLVADEIKRLQKELTSDPFDTELEARYREMISLQQEYILEAENCKNAIRDMVEEGINFELEALEEKISLYQESLDSQKD